jgi:hypothetical protein
MRRGHVEHETVWPRACGNCFDTRRRAATVQMMAILWYLALGALFMLIAIPMYMSPNPYGRHRVAKAQADTRHIANAVSLYFAHCSGLPADSSRTDCPVAAEPGGPHPLPKSLFVWQTNARGQFGGPFLNGRPTLPSGWTGAGNSYAYTVLSDSKFLICAAGDSTGADSDGGAPTECGNRTHPGSGTTGIDDR